MQIYKTLRAAALLKPLALTLAVLGACPAAWSQAGDVQLEGMVAKRCDGVYIGGRTRAWLKIKTSVGREEMRKRSKAWGAAPSVPEARIPRAPS